MTDDDLRALAERLKSHEPVTDEAGTVAHDLSYMETSTLEDAASAILSLIEERDRLRGALMVDEQGRIIWSADHARTELAEARLARAADLIRRKINDHGGADSYDEEWKWWDEARAFLTDLGG